MSRILLIDDRRISLEQARGLLVADGHDPIEATDGLAGLHRAVEDAPDLFVVALALEGLSGLEICRRLADCDATAGRPVIVWGELSNAQGSALARAAGAFAYVDRIHTPAALCGVVRRAVSARTASMPEWAPPAPDRRCAPRRSRPR